MNAMTKVAKMLALMPVVALAAACNGAAPTSSTDFSTDATTDSGQASSLSLRGCPGLIDVTLETVREKTMLWVEARYHFDAPPTPASTGCAAPAWSADRRGLVVDRTNRFRAGFALNGELVVANVTATAPNRLARTIKVDSRTDTASLVPENACQQVSGVNVQVVPVLSGGGAQTVQLVASYLYQTPAPADTACTVAPDWTASRKGLVVGRDGFRATIEPSDEPTTVTAIAPSGARGEVKF